MWRSPTSVPVVWHLIYAQHLALCGARPKHKCMVQSKRLTPGLFPFTLCGFVLLLIDVVDTGVLSLPRVLPSNTLNIDEGGGVVLAGIGQQCPPPSLLLPVPANERCSLLFTPHINGDLVNAHWAALGGCCNHRRQRQLQLLPPLLRFLSSIVFAPPPDSSSRSVLSVPDGGPSCTPTLRCWS